jgi:hypothetical protein
MLILREDAKKKTRVTRNRGVEDGGVKGRKKKEKASTATKRKSKKRQRGAINQLRKFVKREDKKNMLEYNSGGGN